MIRHAHLLLAATLALGSTAALAAPPPFRDVPADSIPLAGPRLIQPLKARTFVLDMQAVERVLRRAPSETLKGVTAPLLALPLPRGGELQFRVVDSPVMAPGLAAKFPETRTYAGVADGDPTITGRFQVDPRGFRAIIFTPAGTVYIDPFSRGDARHHQAYFKHDMPPKRRPPDQVWKPARGVKVPSLPSSPSAAAMRANKGVNIAGDLRTYRLAMGATWQYSDYHDPQLPPNQPRKSVVNAEIVNLVNRVNSVYQRELGIRLVLVENNEDAIYTTPVQPYTNGPDMVETNTLILDENIGNENYDIGHVASTGGGGIAGLGVVCDPDNKGAGVTGLDEPTGDPYYIDFVAHEMGHQFGANHTYNGSEAANCSPNRNPSTAYEPGSGVTIMGYAGVCGGAGVEPSQNIEPHSIDVFHGASFDEIVEYSRNGEGDTCAVKTETGNQPPTADAGTGGFTIPKQTPFELTGGACDPDNDSVLYHWEEFDLGPEGTPNAAANTNAPLFRDYLPTPSPTRIFPAPAQLLTNTQKMGEILPNISRPMKFRLTVRDSRLPGGGVSSADLAFSVTADAGPFLVTAPNAATTFDGLQQTNVTWNVANTATAPVSCANVDITLSTDGGNTFPAVLAAAVANDGSHPVTLPNVDTTTARVKVKCATSIFFDVSNANFTIRRVAGNLPPVASAGPDASVDEGADVVLNGGGSSDPENGVLSFAWVQKAGPAVALAGADTAVPTFTAPAVDADTALTFELTVSDAAGASATDEVVVTVRDLAAQAVDPFTFVTRTGVATNVFVTSEGKVLSGYSGLLPVSVDNGGQYRIDGGAWTSVPGQVAAGSTLTVRHVSASTENTAKVSLVRVGAYETEFRSETIAADRTPDAFSFTTQTGVEPNTAILSNVVTPAGYSTAVAVVPGAGLSYRIDGGEWTTATGTIAPTQTLQVRHTSSGTSLGYQKTSIKVGGVTATFTTRTR